ncbi:DUF4395 domain-containing protein [Cellulomonas sp. URHD0024]|uniref:DUF4395 domain-containing protein n=1 Tax=Cellulomonas sp. URHD0024 TaxID=1302620 RepID=UPI00041735BB|nr:DUF4395 domain-containing protein [Cellulomonas sp. URHD0024]
MSESAPEPSRPAPAVAPASPAGIDPRGPRFGAWINLVLLAGVLLLGAWPAAAAALLALIVVSFAIGTFRGVGHTWQGWVFRTVVRPRLAPPTELEDPRPPTFAQLVGLVITGAGLLLGLLGVPYAIPVAAGFALVAAFLNAVFGLCLGREMYLLGLRLRAGRAAA